MDGPLSHRNDLGLVLVPPVSGTGQMPFLDKWHEQLWNAWSPLLRSIGTVVELDHPESSLPHHINRLKRQGKKPVVVQFRPPHQVYPWPEAPLVMASFWDQGQVPRRPLFLDVRWNWSLTLPFVQGLLTSSSLTRDAWIRGGFSGECLIIPLSPDTVPVSLSAERDGFVAHRLPVGPSEPPVPMEIWQEEPLAPRGVTRRSYFWARRTYHHQVKERMPTWLDKSLLGSWKWVRKQFRKPSPPCWMHPSPLDNPSCVVTMRWDPLIDHGAGLRVLAACAWGLAKFDDTALVVRMPNDDGRWQERLTALARLAERLPSWAGALLAQADSRMPSIGDCLPRLDWAIAWETSLEAAQWVESMRQAGVGIIGTEAGTLADSAAGFPGLLVDSTMLPCSFPGVKDKVLESFRPHPTVESLSANVALAAATTLSGKAPLFAPRIQTPEVTREHLGRFLQKLYHRHSAGRLAA